MQISSRFTIATHILLVIALEGNTQKITSEFLADSIGVNPVIIRKTLSQLKSAGLISVARGVGGAEITRQLEAITLLDIYQAVECLGKKGQLFNFHDRPNPNCPIGRNIHTVLDDRLLMVQTTMENELAQSSLADIVAQTKNKIENQASS